LHTVFSVAQLREKCEILPAKYILEKLTENDKMTYSILYERITDPAFPTGYYQATIPVLDLTTHGLGIEGARSAAQDLAQIWIEEKRANGEFVPIEQESFFSRIDVSISPSANPYAVQP
jgi:predicted RNase H-like HicB family nuclease